MPLLTSFANLDFEAGVDEAGRGCIAGPVVAAAVIFPKDFYHQEINDSKQLSKVARKELSGIIKANALSYGIGVVEAAEIDEINILQASFKAMHLAIAALKITPELLLIDGNRFSPYPWVGHQCIIKGDSKYQSIAAASILAKTYRDDLMENLAVEFPNYKWEENAGYPTPFHKKAIQEFGLCKEHRKTYKPCKAILNLEVDTQLHSNTH